MIYSTEGPLQLHGVQHLSALTRLTELSLRDNAAVGNLTELKHLRQLHTLSLGSYVGGPLRASSLTNIQKLTLYMGTAQTDSELLYPADLPEHWGHL